MDEEAQKIVAVAILLLCFCLGFGYCTRQLSEADRIEFETNRLKQAQPK